jgi:hypothetical protein
VGLLACLPHASGHAVRGERELEAFGGRAIARCREVSRIPPAVKPACAQVGLIPHRQQKGTHRLPIRGGEATLDAADGGLREAASAGERALTETELLAVLTDEESWLRDI